MLTPAVAYYLWPTRWLGAPPDGVPESLPAVADLSQLHDVIVEVALPDDLRACAFRDGMLAYDFAAWGEYNSETTDAMDFHTPRVRVINAHLACLKATTSGDPVIAPATTENVMAVSYDDTGPLEKGTFRGGSMMIGGGAVQTLYFARLQGPHDVPDWRFFRVHPTIGTEEVERSYDLLRQLLECPQRDVALLRAELLTRSQGALSVSDTSGALVYAWTAIEGLLGDLLKRYLDENKARKVDLDPSGNQPEFLNAARRKWLEGAEVTARHKAEILSLVDRLPFDLYGTVEACRKARNKWLHDERHASYDDAAGAILAVQQLFKLSDGVDLQPSA
jgi:hypothetical protein